MLVAEKERRKDKSFDTRECKKVGKKEARKVWLTAHNKLAERNLKNIELYKY